MQIMDRLNNLTPKLKFALALASIGCLLHIIGLGTTYWVVNSFGHVGLWKAACANNGACISLVGALDWVDSCRAFGIIGALSGSVAVLLTLGNIYVKQLKTDMVYVIAAIGNIAAAFSILLTVAIAGGNFSDLENIYFNVEISWSAGLSIAGLLLHLLAGILMGVDRNEMRSQQSASDVTKA